MIFHKEYPKNVHAFLHNWKKIWFFGVKSWFFTWNTPKKIVPPSALHNFFECAPTLTWNPGSSPEIYDVQHIYFVFLFCFSLSCVSYVASFSGMSILIAPSVFSHIYLSTCTLNLKQTAGNNIVVYRLNAIMASSLKWQQFVSLFLHQLRICRRSIDEVKLKSLFNEDGYRPYRSADRNLLFFV